MRLEDEIKQKKFLSEYHKLAVNLLFTSNWLSGIWGNQFKGKGITLNQFNMLRILRGQHPKPASINLIKERMIEKMPDISRLVERLRIKGFVTRKESTQDRRMADVLITDKGLKLLASLDGYQEKVNEMFKTVSVSEARTINELLDKLRN